MADEAIDGAEPPEPAPRKHVVVLRRREDGRDRVFHILGTAHVSKKSIDEVRELIAEVKPDTVCVELDSMRYEALTDETRWRKLDIFQVIRQKKMLFLLASLALQAYQKRIGEQLGVRPGAELLAGCEAAKEIGAELVLADRDVQATLKRTWANLGFFTKAKLLTALAAATFGLEDEIEEEDVERLKDREHIGDMMTELARVMPEVKVPLIDERDRYLMSRIEEAPGDVVVGVVGAGHVAGMVDNFGKEVDRAALERIPPPSKLSLVMKWIIPVVLIGAFYWGWREHQGEALKDMLTAWVLPTSAFCAFFTILAGGKPLSVISAALCAPLTTLHPAIAAGMVVGLVEAWLRRPTVDDCERLGKEVTTLRGAYKNPVSRVLIVAMLSTIGAAIGAYVGLGWVLSYV